MLKKKLKRKKIESLKKLKLRADRIFSIFIRERDKHICYTSGKWLDPKESQCGHYISRSYLALRYDERNCHCQSVAENIFKKGNLPVYALKLEAQYGQGILQELESIKLNNVGDTRIFLNGIIQKYGALMVRANQTGRKDDVMARLQIKALMKELYDRNRSNPIS